MPNYIQQINARLESLLSECKEPLLREVMAYAVLGEGKRTRPQFLLAACEALGRFPTAGQLDLNQDLNRNLNRNLNQCYYVALDFACAIEMIHAYSLAHDDLPAMDNDDFRRGRPTCHKAYDEAMAILAGDGLLSFAVEVMARWITDASANNAARALYCVIKAAGINGMVAGQVSDIQNEGKPVDALTLAAIHSRKTGCLMTAPLEAGGILAGAGDETVGQLVGLGNVIGLAFQIKDDILDVTSTQEDLGKPIGSDAKNKKNTYVTVHGLDAAEAEYKRLWQEAEDILAVLPVKTNALHELVTQTLLRRS